MRLCLTEQSLISTVYTNNLTFSTGFQPQNVDRLCALEFSEEKLTKSVKILACWNSQTPQTVVSS